MSGPTAIEIPHKCFRVTSWTEAVVNFHESFKTGWVFRGQRKACWELLPTIERYVLHKQGSVSDMVPELERGMLSHFQRGAHHYLSSEPVPNSAIDWLALMQHHGAPTRLLDWTNSPYIASFFALERSEEDSAIWAINTDSLDGAVREILGISQSEPLPLAYPEYHRRVLSDGMVGVFPVAPTRSNRRMYVQQGEFLVAGNRRMSFVDNLVRMPSVDTQRDVWRLVLPADVRQEALWDLHRMNISRASLFPGIDGVAQSLKTAFEISLMEREAASKAESTSSSVAKESPASTV